MKIALLLLSALVCGACGGRLDCAPRTVTPTGDLSKDILGSWDSWGVDSRVVATFHPDGGVTMVEEPNQYSPSGGSSTRPWGMLNDGGVVTGSQTWSASIGSDALTLTEEGSNTARVHPALTCRGKGFEP